MLTFLCWQLPTYNGAKSYQNLLVEVYGGIDTGWSGWPSTHMDAMPQQNPTSFVRSGSYAYSSGSISRSSSGHYWQSMANSGAFAWYLYFFSTTLDLQNNYHKSDGYTIRCLVR